MFRIYVVVVAEVSCSKARLVVKQDGHLVLSNKFINVIELC